MENYLKELITLRTDGLVDAMKSMKEIETLFDKVRDSGIVPYIKLGGKVLYRESDLEKLLEECYHPAYRKD